MSDLLLQLGANPRARRLVKSLGLPLPLPEALPRERGPLAARPLADALVAFAALPGGALRAPVADTLAAAGANPVLVARELAPAFAPSGDAFGRPSRLFEQLGDRDRLRGVVLDATGVSAPEGLRALFDATQPLVARLARGGRVVVLARPAPAAETPVAAMARAALDGFVRSLAKELGRSGATANLVLVHDGAEARLPAALRFVLSARSAFVTGQPLAVTSAAKASAGWQFTRSLEGKTALVTGAARGIGEATARALAAEGAHVLCVDRPGEDAPTSRLARELSGTPVLADLAAPGAVEALVHAVRARGGVDVVVHNAGVTRDRTFARMKPDEWDLVLEINAAAIARLHAALEPVLLRDGGRVIALSSISGLAGNVGQTNYAASKAGVAGWVRALAPALAPRGITVNAIAPGFIETRMTAAVPAAIRQVARRLSALGQGGQPEDVANAVAFLATPGAAGVTGAVLRVCGGAFVGA